MKTEHMQAIDTVEDPGESSTRGSHPTDGLHPGNVAIAAPARIDT